MTRAKGTLWVLKRIALALIVVGIVLTAVSCGKQGNIYGEVTGYDYSLYYWSTAAFPAGAYIGYTYLVAPGSYYIYWTNYDATSGYYFPAYYQGYASGFGSNLVYSVLFTVEANPGTFLADGKDNYFYLYLAYNGLGESGAVSSVVPSGTSGLLQPKLGTRTWTQGGLTITATTSIVTLTPEQLAKMPSNPLPKK